MSNWNFKLGCPNSSFMENIPAGTTDPIGYSLANDNSTIVASIESTRRSISKDNNTTNNNTSGNNSSNNGNNNSMNNSNNSNNNAENDELIIKKSWNMALTPAKTLGMSFLMMYMTGTSSGIFGVLVIGYAMINSFEALFKVNNVYKQIDENRNFFLQKFSYISICILGISYVLYFCHTLGLLPINTADYVSFIQKTDIQQISHSSINM